MPNNRTGQAKTQLMTSEALLSLLAVICGRSGHTFSWYTSKKGRVWLTLKGFYPTVYSTSVESTPSPSYVQTVDALMVLYAHHVPKLRDEDPPLTTWLNAKDVQDKLAVSSEYCQDIWQRWQDGEAFWASDYPDAPSPSVDNGPDGE